MVIRLDLLALVVVLGYASQVGCSSNGPVCDCVVVIVSVN